MLNMTDGVPSPLQQSQALSAPLTLWTQPDSYAPRRAINLPHQPHLAISLPHIPLIDADRIDLSEWSMQVTDHLHLLPDCGPFRHKKSSVPVLTDWCYLPDLSATENPGFLCGGKKKEHSSGVLFSPPVWLAHEQSGDAKWPSWM